MKSFLFGLVIAAALIGGGITFLRRGATRTDVTPQAPVDNVTVVDGMQFVTIKVKGGYQPKVSKVKAGMPTILRFETKGTFDCSSAISIPSKDVDQMLPATGTTDVPVGQLAVGELKGSCGMGMYRFSVVAE